MLPEYTKAVGPVIKILSLDFTKFNSPPKDPILSLPIFPLSKSEETDKDADPQERVSPTPFSYCLLYTSPSPRD